jgi:hypothetical protein
MRAQFALLVLTPTACDVLCLQVALLICKIQSQMMYLLEVPSSSTFTAPHVHQCYPA